MSFLRRGQKKIVMGVLTVSMLLTCITAYIVASSTDPELSIYGVVINTMDDGSVQLIYDVGVQGHEYASVASMTLQYNDQYMVPSDYETNEPLVTTGSSRDLEDGFFRQGEDLYHISGESANPYQTMISDSYGSLGYSRLDSSASTIHLSLSFQAESQLAVSGYEFPGALQPAKVGFSSETTMVVNSASERVSLGTLSFRVDVEHLETVISKFGAIIDTTDPTVDSDYLLRVHPTAAGELYAGSEVWSLSFYKSQGFQGLILNNDTNKSNSAGNTEFYYNFEFENTIIAIEPAAKDVVIDAYLAYNLGTSEDITTILGKYSPMVTAVYADGSRQNFLMPWGMENTSEFEYDYTVYHNDDGALGNPLDPLDYDPTGNEEAGITPDYIVQQYYYVAMKDELGVVTYEKHPVPITVTVAITPITVTGISAENSEKTYQLHTDLLNDVQEITHLELPAKVRLMTDIVPDGSTLSLEVSGWTSVNSGTVWPVGDDLSTLWEDTATSGDPHWPTRAEYDSNSGVWGDHLGTYSFVLADTYGGTPTSFTTNTVRSKYPWITVADNWEASIQVKRHIVPVGELTDARYYLPSHVSTVSDTTDEKNPILTLNVGKKGLNSLEVDLHMSDSEIRVYMPNGAEVEDSWFSSATGSSYQVTSTTVNGFTSYQMTMNPGDTSSGNLFDVERELLRRYINLGGWFYVSVNELDAGWSELIPVYVESRINEHTESKEYHLLGINANLMSYPSDTYVALPPGEFVPVDTDGVHVFSDVDGNPLYIDADGVQTTDKYDSYGNANTLMTTSYGVSTLYDGSTGAQPGTLNNFQVNDWQSQALVGDLMQAMILGEFVDGNTYQAYKEVTNSDAHTATFSREGEISDPTVDPDLIEEITLTTTYTNTEYIGDNVSLVTYDTVQEGYSIRQEVTLTITNTGEVDIYGLFVNVDIEDHDGGGHYTMLREPASFLAVGQSTTFTLTYVYDLAASDDPYRDTLYITSSTKNDIAGDDYLLDFDAQFQVSKDPVYYVTVECIPATGMGTAGVIIGEHYEAAEYTMNTADGGATHAANTTVYIGVNLFDEYTIKSITYTYGGHSSEIIPTKYVSGDGTVTAELEDGWEVYYFTMPENFVHVVVEFEETVYSKLRFSDLDAFAVNDLDTATAHSNLKPDNLTPPEYLLYQKSFTAEEYLEATEFQASGTRTEAEYLVQVGTANGDIFDSSEDQYLVVVPYNTTWVQLEAVMREVDTSLMGNEGIAATVEMNIIGSEPTDMSKVSILGGTVLYTNATPNSAYSNPFEAPDMGSSVYVEVQLTGEDSSGLVTRLYYVEVYRSDEFIQANLYNGNSPYGLILNDDEIDESIKEEAFQAFIDNGYSFEGLDPAYIPKVLVDNDMVHIHYSSEAWAKSDSGYLPDTIYEPDSYTGIGDLAIYDPEDNLDLGAKTLFVGINEEFYEPGVIEILDSSGREVAFDRIARYIDVVLLDENATTQQDRFSEPDEDDASRRMWRLMLGKVSENEVAAGWAENAARPVIGNITDGYEFNKDAEENYIFLYEVIDDEVVLDDNGDPVYKMFEAGDIRPGAYDMVYSFLDFDHSTTIDSVIRTLVLLGPVGDANADNFPVNTDDKDYIQNRLSDPLGYTVEDYSDANVFRFRQVDSNNDRNINNIDANEIMSSDRIVDQYYLYTDYINQIP